MKALLLILLLTGCATVDDLAAKFAAGGGCVTLNKVIQAVESAWNDGFTKGHRNGEDNAPPSCKRAA